MVWPGRGRNLESVPGARDMRRLLRFSQTHCDDNVTLQYFDYCSYLCPKWPSQYDSPLFPPQGKLTSERFTASVWRPSTSPTVSVRFWGANSFVGNSRRAATGDKAHERMCSRKCARETHAVCLHVARTHFVTPNSNPRLRARFNSHLADSTVSRSILPGGQHSRLFSAPRLSCVALFIP